MVIGLLLSSIYSVVVFFSTILGGFDSSRIIGEDGIFVDYCGQFSKEPARAQIEDNS